MLVSLKGASQGEIQLIDLETTTVLRTFKGHKQGDCVLRSTFGGANENFIVSGSDGAFKLIFFLSFFSFFALRDIYRGNANE